MRRIISKTILKPLDNVRFIGSRKCKTGLENVLIICFDFKTFDLTFDLTVIPSRIFALDILFFFLKCAKNAGMSLYVSVCDQIVR